MIYPEGHTGLIIKTNQKDEDFVHSRSFSFISKASNPDIINNLMKYAKTA